jgi:hypothetical protein
MTVQLGGSAHPPPTPVHVELAVSFFDGAMAGTIQVPCTALYPPGVPTIP